MQIPDDASVVMGHTRMTTQGNEKMNFNNHPFLGKVGKMEFALAHNGVLYNDASLRKSLKLPHTGIQTDSYIAVQLLEKERTIDFASLRYMAEQVNGSFAFTVLDAQNNLYFVKGDNPLCIYRYKKTGLLIYASTSEILNKALAKLKMPLERPEHLEISCGDIWKVDSSGAFTEATFDTANLFHSWYLTNYQPYKLAGIGAPPRRFHENQYIKDIKGVAGYFGYGEDDIDQLLAEGFTPEELEEYLYYQKF
jgi:glutamine phosphoribosylpyrophosphate amidotransferase